MRKKIIIVSVVYWILLLYMLAALVWWFFVLEHQNNYLTNLRIAELKKDDIDYESKLALLLDNSRRKTIQYLSEGLTFLGLILFGALYIYRVIKTQLKISQLQQNFMMAVTHELKTPIAITQLNLETLLIRSLTQEQQKKLLEKTLVENERLNELCSKILLAAQLDSGKYHPQKNTVYLKKIIETSIRFFQARFSERLIYQDIPDIPGFQGEPFLFQILINNLIENALKYSPVNSPIYINLSLSNKKIIIQIKDEGIGISAEEKQKVFSKFYRSGDENIRRTKGTGLGLYLCKKITNELKGKIVLLDNQPKGSIFKIILPQK